MSVITRPSKTEIDELIIDRAASTFARFGFTTTSVQAVADAVGYSKAGLLHRFPSKEALQHAIVDRCCALTDGLNEAVEHLPFGRERDHLALTTLVDLCNQRPGCSALLLSLVGVKPDDDPSWGRLWSLGARFLSAFDHADAPKIRQLRLVASLGAVTTLAVAAHTEALTEELRSEMIESSYDALGHHRP